MAGDLAGPHGARLLRVRGRYAIATRPARLLARRAGLFAFVWLELASPDPGSLAAVEIWLLIYLAVTLAGALVCGPRWCAHADPFEVYSMVAAAVGRWRRNADGRIAVGNPFDHLLSLPVRPGTVAVLAVLLGSTAFDSFSAMPQWRNFVDSHTPGSWDGQRLQDRRPAAVRGDGGGHLQPGRGRHRRCGPGAAGARCPG